MSENAKPKPKSKKKTPRKEGDAQLNCWISGDVDQALRRKVFEDDTTLTHVVEEALRNLLKVPKQDARALA